MDYLSNPLVVSAAKSVSGEPTLVKNRARAAVVVDKGYGVLDAYAANQSLLFILGVLGASVSGTMLYKRRNAEARVLYSITLATSLALSWFTRPEALRAAPALAPGEEPPTTPAESASRRVVGWLDQNAQQNAQQNPAWENETWARLSQDMGAGTIPPAVNALLIT
jgi:hypothetical protein